MNQPGAAADVHAALTFIVPRETKPRLDSAALTGGMPRPWFDTESRRVKIRDMRPGAAGLSLDREGFELIGHRTGVVDFYDDDELNRVYDGELVSLLGAATGADRAIVFDRTRRADAPGGALNADGTRRPADRAHVDYTVISGPQRARDALGGGEVDRVLHAGGRIVQVNVWRPIRGPVRRTPLALADAASVRAEQLVATDHVFPGRVGEIYHLAYADEQRWYWAPEMRRDEVLLIKGWDSRDDGRARFTPHSAFSLPDQASQRAPPRESIEVRTYLIFDA